MVMSHEVAPSQEGLLQGLHTLAVGLVVLIAVMTSLLILFTYGIYTDL